MKIGRRLPTFVYRFRAEETRELASNGNGLRTHITCLSPRRAYPPAAFLKTVVRGRFPEGVVARLCVDYTAAGDKRPVKAYVPLERRGSGKLVSLVKFDVDIIKVSVETETKEGGVRIRRAKMRRVWPPETAVRLFLDQLIKKWRSPKSLAGWLGTAGFHLKTSGLLGLKEWLRIEAMQNCFRIVNEYSSWVDTYDLLSQEDHSQIRKKVESLPNKPLISIVMPVYNTDERWLRPAIDSVLGQLYPFWELCIADDHSPSPHVRQILEEYTKADPRIKVVYRAENGHISAASNSALALASGEFIALLDHDDELSPHALYMVAEELNRNSDLDLIYSDEDKIDAIGRRFNPHFKPDWNPDLFYSFNLVTHLAVFRTSLLREVGGFRAGYDGSQDYDLTLRVVERTQPSRIRHIPFVLYHWRAILGSVALGAAEKRYAHIAGRKAIQDHLDRMRIAGKVVPAGDGSTHRVIYSLPDPLPLVSIVICTRDRVDLLRGVVQGVLEKTDYSPLELIIVDNQSQDPETLAYLEKIRHDPRVRVLPYDAPFNFSAMNNFAVKEARGEIITLLNNDIEVISPEWLREMVSFIIQPGVGAVGAKLLYPNDTLQHAGVILGIGGVAAHAYCTRPKSDPGYMGRGRVAQSLSAVTGACLMTKREIFQAVGGLDEKNLPIAFNDIDLCIKIRERGFRIVWTPFAELYHLESASRGSDVAPEKAERFAREARFMMAKWGHLLENDPFYNPNLTLQRTDFRMAFPPRVTRPWDGQPSSDGIG